MISVMFHSAGLNNLRWRSSHASEPLDKLKEKLEVIHQEGYRSVFMKEAAKYSGRTRDRTIHLTFDDGYLDNWVHIFPLLKKYGLKCTIFVSSDFIDPRSITREKKYSYERDHDPIGCCAGFLSFDEMKQMEDSGLVEIQSHSKTHTWYFSSPEIVDFWHPGAGTEPLGPVWMVWNKFPQRKPFYHIEADKLENKIPYGTPVYSHGKSLETIRYLPDEEKLNEKLIELAESKNKEFFLKKGWRNEFRKIVDDFRKKHGLKGRHETRKEYLDRVALELSESKYKIEKGLGHSINGICWPGGAVTEDVLEIAKGTGYKYFTLPTKWKGNNRNDAGMISRISNLPRLKVKGRNLGYPSRNDFKNYLRGRNGYITGKWFYNLSRLGRLLKEELSLRRAGPDNIDGQIIRK